MDPMQLFINHEHHVYMVVDPFNRTYNAAKVQTKSEEAFAYQNAFKRAFLTLKKGQSPLNPFLNKQIQ